MKKTFLFAIIMAMLGIAMAQSNLCPVVGIKTNPLNAQNPQRPALTNTFNWMDKNAWQMLEYGRQFNISGVSIFEGVDPYTNSANIAAGNQSDYYPQDGWELIKMNFGYLMGGTVQRYEMTPVPYIMLYNKFQSKLRVIATTANVYAGFNVMQVNLFHDPVLANSATGTGLSMSGTLNVNDYTAHALDSNTRVASAYAAVNTTGTNDHFFYVDFPVMYDPCVCFFKSELSVKFELKSISDITLSGTFSGQVVTNTTSGNAPNSLKIMKAGSTVLNMGFNVATGAYTNPTVAVKDFGGLISAISPLTDAYTQTQLTEFASIVTLGTDVFGQLNGFDTTTVKNKLKEGKAAFASLTKYLDGKIKSVTAGKESGTVIFGALEAKGQEIGHQALDGGTIVFGTPGSLGSGTNPEEKSLSVLDANNHVKPEYAYYNEALGILGLLETPTVDIKDNQTLFAAQLTYPYYETKYFREVDFAAELMSDIKFVLNPVLDVNYAKSEIKAELKVDMSFYNPNNNNITVSPSQNIRGQQWWSGHGFYDIIPQYKGMGSVNYFPNSVTYSFNKRISNKNFDYYSTGLGSLQRLRYDTRLENKCVYELPSNTTQIINTVYLSILLDLELNSISTSGKPNRVYQLLTFPVKVNKVNNMSAMKLVNGVVYPFGIYVKQNSNNFSGDALSIIGIGNETPPYTISNPSPVNTPIVFRASEQIYLNGEVELYGEYVLTSLDGFYQDGFFKGNVQNYCQQGQYKAANPSARYAEAISEFKTKVASLQDVSSAYPNPTKDIVNFELNLADASPTSLYITDMLGIKVADIVSNESLRKGVHNYSFNTEGLAGGIYLYTTEIKGEKYSKRLVVVKD